ncbi:FAD-binding protein [Nonomuraea ferruginea]|uniref:FAD-binding protein n=1 Tax=Nonomuraea ferruginea TaxID=46174 RepID=UPI0036220273
MSRTYEVVVVGGGVAGLSGAVTLARARRTVLVVDSGRSREEPAIPGVGREEVARYGARSPTGRSPRSGGWTAASASRWPAVPRWWRGGCWWPPG